MLNPNRVLSKAQILDHVWDYDFRGEAGIVESYISYLRRKIDVDGPAADPHQARRRLRAAPAPRVRMTAAFGHRRVPVRAGAASGGASTRCRLRVRLVAVVLVLLLTALTLTGLTTIFLIDSGR